MHGVETQLRNPLAIVGSFTDSVGEHFLRFKRARKKAEVSRATGVFKASLTGVSHHSGHKEGVDDSF